MNTRLSPIYLRPARGISTVLLIAWSFLAVSAFAQTSWTAGTGSWFTAANWSAGVPTAATAALINNGSTVNLVNDSGLALNVVLAQNGGNAGTLAVFGIGGSVQTLDVANILSVGSLGAGTLRISGNSIVNDRFGFIGLFTGSIGTATVTGPGVWNNSENLAVGGDGQGSLIVQSGGKVTAKNGSVYSSSGLTATAIVTGAGSSWTNSGTLDIGIQGPGALTVVDSGNVSAAGLLTIYPGNTVNVGAGALPGTLSAGGIANSGTFRFNHTGGATLSSPISGAGLILKDGTGTSTITSAASFTGTFAVNTGQLVLKNALGPATYLVNSGGTLRFDSATVGLSATGAIRASGGLVEYLNSTINGGFLRGPGTHTVIAAGTATFNGVTTFNSTAMIQNGDANFINSSLGGTLTSNASLNFDGVVNASSGTITINSSLLAQDFTNHGVFTINNGGSLDNGANSLVFGSGSRTTINNGGVVFISDGTTIELNGALLVNNGEINGTTNVNYGSLAKGGGIFGIVNVRDGGKFSPGNSPGTSTLAGLRLGDGGRYVFELNSANATPGAGADFLNIIGSLDLEAGTTTNRKLTIEVVSLNSTDQSAALADFNSSQPYSFTLATAAGGINGFSADEFAVDASGFKNDLAGGSFSVAESADGNSLLLRFNPVPEPGTPAIMLIALGTLIGIRRRRIPDELPPSR